MNKNIVPMDMLMEYAFLEATNRKLPISEFKMQKLIFKINRNLEKI